MAIVGTWNVLALEPGFGGVEIEPFGIFDTIEMISSLQKTNLWFIRRRPKEFDGILN